jgi:diguanylate cyclase (GGDEF)-like protein
MINQIIESYESYFRSFLETTSLSKKEKHEIYERFVEILEKLFLNFKEVLNSIEEGIVIVDQEESIKEANDTFLNWLNLEKEKIVGKKIDEFLIKEKNRVYLKGFVPVEIKTQEFEINGVKYKRIILLNIKQKIDIEVRLKNVLRLYKVLTQINELIIRAVDKNEIYKTSCEVLVKEGHFDFAWIGEIKNGKVAPVFWYGENENFKAFLKGNLFGLDIKKILEKGYLKENELKNEEEVFTHKITIPIFKEENAISAVVTHKFVTAVLVVYYKGREFKEEEINLLKQIAHDVGFGIVTIATKEDIDYLAYYDVLTSLPNRRYFFDQLESVLEILKQKNQKGFLAVIDINNFKIINSTIGYWAGDIVLKKIAKTIKKILKKKDILARIEGDKFALFLYDVENEEEASNRLKKFLKDFEFIFEIENKKFLITVSVGAAFFPKDGLTKEALFASAETALMEAKTRGKGLEFYTANLNREETLEKLNLESELVEGIRKDQFVVYYQPIVDIRENKIAMAEALIRWEKDGKLISPAKFVPILEKRGLIKEVGFIVMDKVFKTIRDNDVKIPISVNISVKQIHIGFYKEVESLLEKYDISPKLVILEITESVLMENLEILLKNIKELSKIGVKFEIDDFGTGYSSLAYLKKLPIFALKIDMTFIKDLPENEEDASITKAIISMGHSLGKKIIAEGVEKEIQVKFLKENGCDYIQGFYYSKPLPEAEFLKYIK